MTRTRGFATSGAYLVIGIAIFIAFGTLYTVASNTAERVSEAQQAARDHRTAARMTGVTVTDAEWDESATNLTIEVNNTGERTLAVNDTAVLVDGRYVSLSSFEEATIDGRSWPSVWRPGQQLTLVDGDVSSAPTRVKVVVENGIADAMEVATVS